MKSRHKIFLLVPILFLVAQISSGETTHASGEVTLPYNEFEKIYQTLKEEKWRKKNPPKNAILTDANYHVHIDEKNTNVTATFHLNVLAERDWVSLPVLPSSLAIRHARLDGQLARLYTDGDYHYLASQEPGLHTLEVSFAIKNGYQGSDSLLIPVLPTPIAQLTIEIPAFAGSDISITPAQSLDSSQQGDKRQITALLSATESIIITWKRPQQLVKRLPPKLFANVSTLLAIGEGVMRQESLIHYSILQSPIRSLSLLVPKDFNVLSVSGADLVEWKAKAIGKKKQQQQVTVKFAKGQQGSYTLRLKGERVLSGTSAQGEAPAMILEKVERETGYIGVAATTNIEISPLNQKGVINRIDVQEVPREIWNLSPNPLLIGYKYLKHPYEIALDIKKHDDVPSLVATADRGEGITVCAKSGDCVTRLTYQVRNNLKQFLKIQLPPHAEYWSAFVSEKPVKAGWNKDKELLVPLEKSQGDYDEARSFPLEIVYHQEVSRFAPVGRKSFILPLPDIPISRLAWSFYLPKNFVMAKFGGTLEEIRATQHPSGLFGRRSRIAAPASQMAPIPVQREEQLAEFDDSSIAKKSKLGRSQIYYKDNISMNAQQAQGLISDLRQAVTSGVLPVRVSLPQEGHLYRFSQLFVEKERPTLAATYYVNWLHSILLIGFFTLLLWLGHRAGSQLERLGWRMLHPLQKIIAATVLAIILLIMQTLQLSLTIGLLGVVLGASWHFRHIIKEWLQKCRNQSESFIGFSGLASSMRTVILIVTFIYMAQAIWEMSLDDFEFWFGFILLGAGFFGITIIERLAGWMQKRKQQT